MSNTQAKVKHAQFNLPKPQVHAKHPFRNKDSEDALLEYIKDRLASDRINRDNRVTRYSQIDRDVAGWIRLEEDDKKRKRKHRRDGSPQATAINLPLAFIHIDDMMTYYAQTFAPNRGMFYHTADTAMTTEAEQLVKIMNNHATYGSYYRELLLTIFATLKYNIGGMSSFWATDYGPSMSGASGDNEGVAYAPVFAGNKVESLDMYNTFWDPSIDVAKLHKDGEWYATAKMRSHYWLKQKCMDSVYFNCEEFLGADAGIATLATLYYKDPPAESRIQADESGGGESWYSILSGSSFYESAGSFEIVEVYIKINPNDFGLVQGDAAAKKLRNRYEVWRITMLNGERIISADYMNNIHGYLPAFFGIQNDDVMKQAAKSPAEILNPLQEFSSFLMNTHVKANRKNLYGTTFYDPSCVSFDNVPEGEVAARIPLKPQGYGRDIREMVQHDSHVLDTNQTLQDLQGMIGIINQFFPTQSLPSQVAGIDRAIDSQVAAVQQGANRRQHKGARLLDDTLMRPLRFSLYYNIIQYQQDGEDITDYFSNTTITVDLQSLRTTDLAYVIGQGLKAIDRQSIAQQMQKVFFGIIQAPMASQQMDIIKLLGYWMSMMDIDANVEQFRLPPPPPQAQPQVGPDGQPIPPGAPGAPAAGGASIVPATNPAIITGAINGRGTGGP